MRVILADDAVVIRQGLARRDGHAAIEVADDGCGGANPQGAGLSGLRDRVEALDGQFHIDSPPGLGTTLIAEIPLGGHG